jgi:thiamine biosynthesis lipoprotein
MPTVTGPGGIALPTPPATPGGHRAYLEMIMGLPFSLHIRGPFGPLAEAAAVQAVWASLRQADRVFSTFRPDSDISRIDRGELTVADADPAVAAVLEIAERARLATAGAFDVCYAGRLDPSGIVKGWAAVRAGTLIDLAGADWYLNAGGDVLLRSASGEPWRVGIEHPTEPGALSAVLRLANGAVATSGSAHRGRHIVDPATGCAAAGIRQATVYGPDLVWADAFATAIVAGGPPRDWTLPEGYRYLLIPE